ncbi:MAG: Thioredox-DsbH domain-containing protein [Lachnoclostridium sp.]|jgi:uncharacterized protein
MANKEVSNRLAKEKSPYLLQHAHNPVDWFPWGEEAFYKAKAEDKPIFLSIGYSTCHWCHVMAHESFEDKEVADYLNRYFVSIKVDKEERPDIDNIYMSVCQHFTGSGGWPLSIFMLPDQKPFFAGTYFPKRSRYNMPGFLDLLKAIKEKWEKDRDSLLRTGEEITSLLKEETDQKGALEDISEELITSAVKSLTGYFDKEYGGFGRAPKFPTPHNLMFLLREAYYKRDKLSLTAVEKTLDGMYRGGIFDHIGYGFSRYSTDEKWLVPHFEKMLYDNGLLILTYLDAYQFTKKDHYRQIAEMTMEYVLREMTSEDGGFYCAQDADSEGVEGKYYVFTPEEIIELLGEKEGRYFNEYYGITAKGNFEGKSIPNRLHGKTKQNLEDDRITPLRIKVLKYRMERTSLHKDDKILTSWNGIMIAAFARAYKILGREMYLQAAKRAEAFIRDNLCKENTLYVHYRDKEAKGIGHIDDYAYYCLALIELYEATFDLSYLCRGEKLARIMMEKFMDVDKGGFYLYASDAENLIHRPKEIYDGAMPSGNSVAAYVLVKLSAYTGDIYWIEAAKKQMAYICSNIAEYPGAHCFSLMALMLMVYPSKELIAVIPKEAISKLRKGLSEHFLPNLTVLVKTKENKEPLTKFSKFTEDYQVNEKEEAYYLCENHACRSPVHDIRDLNKLLIK